MELRESPARVRPQSSAAQTDPTVQIFLGSVEPKGLPKTYFCTIRCSDVLKSSRLQLWNIVFSSTYDDLFHISSNNNQNIKSKVATEPLVEADPIGCSPWVNSIVSSRLASRHSHRPRGATPGSIYRRSRVMVTCSAKASINSY